MYRWPHSILAILVARRRKRSTHGKHAANCGGPKRSFFGGHRHSSNSHRCTPHTHLSDDTRFGTIARTQERQAQLLLCARGRGQVLCVELAVELVQLTVQHTPLHFCDLGVDIGSQWHGIGKPISHRVKKLCHSHCANCRKRAFLQHGRRAFP